MTLPSSTPRVWNYWMWDENRKYQYEYDHTMLDHPDKDFLWKTDWEFAWSEKFFWTAKEAALLSFGRSPTQVSWDDPHWGVQQADCDSEFATHACSIYREIIDAQTKGVLPEPIPAAVFVEWALSTDMPFPPDLALSVISRFERVMNYTDQLEDQQRSSEVVGPTETKIHPRRKNNYLRVILGIAREKYHHPKPGAARKIADTLIAQKLAVSEQTVLDFLKEAENSELENP